MVLSEFPGLNIKDEKATTDKRASLSIQGSLASGNY